uniref:Uncharacterized protein n=1 Tax=Anguilla anguilla TaxID=7936 RepID=A0A0E9VPX5_ANGAN
MRPSPEKSAALLDSVDVWLLCIVKPFLTVDVSANGVD